MIQAVEDSLLGSDIYHRYLHTEQIPMRGTQDITSIRPVFIGTAGITGCCDQPNS